MQNRSFSRAQALARLSPAAALAASAAIGMGLVMGCNAPVSPHFELYFDSNSGAGCTGAAMEDVRLMCDSTVRLRVLDANRGFERDLVPPVCRKLDPASFDEPSEFGTMQALDKLRVQLPELPLGQARFQVEIWRADMLDPDECSSSPDGEPAVRGEQELVVGEDADVLVPLRCLDLAQVNRFEPGCSIDVEIGNLERGTKLRMPPRSVEREDPAMIDEPMPGTTESENPGLDPRDLSVRFGFAKSSGSAWYFNDLSRLTLHAHDDGTAVWRFRPGDDFWTDQLPEHESLCIEVTRKDEDDVPQLSCIQAEVGAPSARVQASYLPPEDLACLLAANGASSVPEEGIVMGRVVQPVIANVPPDSVQVERPAANVQVFPTAANLPQPADPLLKLAAFAALNGDEDDRDGASGEDVQYVSKDSEMPSRGTSACRVDDTSATTSSGYFLSDASFPAHWEIEAGNLVNEGHDMTGSTTDIADGAAPGRTLMGGRIPGTVSVVRIPLH